jgi:hypothetical protein
MPSSTPRPSALLRSEHQAQALAVFGHALRLLAWFSAQAAFADGLSRVLNLVQRHYGPSHAPPFAVIAVCFSVACILLPPVCIQWRLRHELRRDGRNMPGVEEYDDERRAAAASVDIYGGMKSETVWTCGRYAVLFRQERRHESGRAPYNLLHELGHVKHRDPLLRALTPWIFPILVSGLLIGIIADALNVVHPSGAFIQVPQPLPANYVLTVFFRNLIRALMVGLELVVSAFLSEKAADLIATNGKRDNRNQQRSPAHDTVLGTVLKRLQGGTTSRLATSMPVVCFLLGAGAQVCNTLTGQSRGVVDGSGAWSGMAVALGRTFGYRVCSGIVVSMQTSLQSLPSLGTVGALLLLALPPSRVAQSAVVVLAGYAGSACLYALILGVEAVGVLGDALEMSILVAALVGCVLRWRRPTSCSPLHVVTRACAAGAVAATYQVLVTEHENMRFEALFLTTTVAFMTVLVLCARVRTEYLHLATAVSIASMGLFHLSRVRPKDSVEISADTFQTLRYLACPSYDIRRFMDSRFHEHESIEDRKAMWKAFLTRWRPYTFVQESEVGLITSDRFESQILWGGLAALREGPLACFRTKSRRACVKF